MNNNEVGNIDTRELQKTAKRKCCSVVNPKCLESNCFKVRSPDQEKNRLRPRATEFIVMELGSRVRGLVSQSLGACGTT